MKKEYTILSAIIAAGVIIGAGSTIAFFTGTSLAANSVKTGNVGIEIRESAKDNEKIDSWVVESGGAEDDVVLTYKNVVPGDELSKEVFVDNIGTNDAYIRCRIKAYYYDTVTKEYLEEAKGLTYYLDGKPVELEGGDTVYYENILIAGPEGTDGRTMRVFDQVKVPETWGNVQSEKIVRIKVTAEAVQSDNNISNPKDAFFGVVITEREQSSEERES